MQDQANQKSAVTRVEVPDAFELWLDGRPKWLQTAASRLIASRRMPNEQERIALMTLCIAEASGEKGDNFEKVTPGSLAQAAQQPALRICELADVRGVNAIKNGATLNFGRCNLAMVYGPNGSGKTGFTRLLKEACGSRAKDDFYGNVFEEVSPPGSATIHVSVGDQPRHLNWTAEGGALPALRHVHVFDSKTASMYVVKDNGVNRPAIRGGSFD